MTIHLIINTTIYCTTLTSVCQQDAEFVPKSSYSRCELLIIAKVVLSNNILISELSGVELLERKLPIDFKEIMSRSTMEGSTLIGFLSLTCYLGQQHQPLRHL